MKRAAAILALLLLPGCVGIMVKTHCAVYADFAVERCAVYPRLLR